MKIFDSTKIPILSKALGVYSLRQKVASSNIANISTPGYRALAVSFESELDSAMKTPTPAMTTTDANHLQGANEMNQQENEHIVDAVDAGFAQNDPYASGVNNVDIDHEMSYLAENQLRFKYAARLINEEFKEIQNSIRGQE